MFDSGLVGKDQQFKRALLDNITSSSSRTPCPPRHMACWTDVLWSLLSLVFQDRSSNTSVDSFSPAGCCFFVLQRDERSIPESQSASPLELPAVETLEDDRGSVSPSSEVSVCVVVLF